MSEPHRKMNRSVFSEVVEEIKKEMSMTGGGYVHNDPNKPKKKKNFPTVTKALSYQVLIDEGCETADED